MSPILKYSDVAHLGKFKALGFETLEQGGRHIDVVKLSLRKSSLLRRIIDISLLVLIATVTLGAGLEFPCSERLMKSVSKGRQSIFYIDRSSLSKRTSEFFSRLFSASQ